MELVKGYLGGEGGVGVAVGGGEESSGMKGWWRMRRWGVEDKGRRVKDKNRR